MTKIKARDKPLQLAEILHCADMMGADIDQLHHIENTYCGTIPTERKLT